MGTTYSSQPMPADVKVTLPSAELRLPMIPADFQQLELYLTALLSSVERDPLEYFTLNEVHRRKSYVISDSSSYAAALRRTRNKTLRLVPEYRSYRLAFQVPACGVTQPDFALMLEEIEKLVTLTQTQTEAYFVAQAQLFQCTKQFSAYLAVPSIEKAVTMLVFHFLADLSADSVRDNLRFRLDFPYITVGKLELSEPTQQALAAWHEFVSCLENLVPRVSNLAKAYANVLTSLRSLEKVNKSSDYFPLLGHLPEFVQCADAASRLAATLKAMQATVTKKMKAIASVLDLGTLVKLARMKEAVGALSVQDIQDFFGLQSRLKI